MLKSNLTDVGEVSGGGGEGEGKYLRIKVCRDKNVLEGRTMGRTKMAPRSQQLMSRWGWVTAMTDLMLGASTIENAITVV